MAQKKNPGSKGTLRGTGKHKPAVSGAAYHQKKWPENDAIWDGCREAQDADASRKAQADAKLQAAALRLGFARNENGRWEKQCPHCKQGAALYVTKNGEVSASSLNTGRTCAALPSIQKWLLDEGFQS